MKALDTNVLIRYLTQDDQKQSRLATQVIEQNDRAGESLFISSIVLCEVAWVLRTAYRKTRTEIAFALSEILDRRVFTIDQEQEVRVSIDRYQKGKGDFADYFISTVGKKAGCDQTVTFDQALRGDSGFTILS